MQQTLEFPDLLRLIDDRSTAFSAAVAASPALDVPVPTCPGWTLLDLAQHLGEGRRAWSATIAARGSAHELVLASYGRVPPGFLEARR